MILKFGHLTTESFRSSSSLQLLADLVSVHENASLFSISSSSNALIQRGIIIIVQRSGQSLALTLTPRKGWGGRGMLGYDLPDSVCVSEELTGVISFRIHSERVTS